MLRSILLTAIMFSFSVSIAQGAEVTTSFSIQDPTGQARILRLTPAEDSTYFRKNTETIVCDIRKSCKTNVIFENVGGVYAELVGRNGEIIHEAYFRLVDVNSPDYISSGPIYMEFAPQIYNNLPRQPDFSTLSM